jgi:Protein of unknown function (DUF2817)
VSGAVRASRHFSRSYSEARDKFLAATGACGAPVETHLLPELRGVDGEALAMDVARLGDAGAPGMLMLWSATHGIEGYCGSGCQVGLLSDSGFLAAVAEAGVAVLFVHAINPHGFSYGRRVNEDNADLNRNFRDFAAPAPVNAAYAEIHRHLLPAEWPPGPANEMELGAWIAGHGERAYQTAVSSGQYAFPAGMFFGGAGPSWSNRTLRSVLRAHAARRTALGLIDIHTGLGPRGHGEKIYDGPDVAGDFARTRSWWGDDVTSFHDGSSTSARLVGVNYNAVYDECPGAAYAGIGLEYGTLPLLEVFQALRADHWLHNYPDAPDALATGIRRQMREAFYIEADDWKDTVYAQARMAALTAIARLAHPSEGEP